MEAVALWLAAVAAVLILIVYKNLTKNRGYWKSRGIPEPPGTVIGFGHTLDQFLMRKNIGQVSEEFYKACPNDSMVGIYVNQTPVLMVRDPALVKFVLHSGFPYFADMQMLDPKVDPLLHVDPFFKNGQDWKDSRGIFVSAFSSKKLKTLIPAINETCEKLVSYVKTKVPQGSPVDIEAKDVFGRYTADVGANAFLGIDGHSFADKVDPQSLVGMGKSMFDPSYSAGIRHSFFFLLPALSQWLSTGWVPGWINELFPKMIQDIKSMRRSDSTPRNDVLQHIENYLKQNNLDESTLPSHMFGFFIEAYETSSLTLSLVTYFMGKYPKVQEKMRQEVESVLKKHGSCCYEAINDMTYVEQVIKETMRFYPPVGRMFRLCSKPVTLEGPDGLTCDLKPGDEVHVPVMGLHRDAKYWDNPNEFIPERFDKDNESPRDGYVYLPFGEGPRACPGQRMGILQIKAALTTILTNFVIEPSKKMREPVEIDGRYFMTTLRGGFWVRLRRRN